MAQHHNLRVDGERLWQSLMAMARIGATAKGGCNRQALTPEDHEARHLFKHWCEAAGCTVRTDRLGSMFARREGLDDLPPILIGSHLDTQPTGGKFDGVLGVLAGLEIIRSLNDAGLRTRRPIEIINWTNEEGCRFAPAMLASAAYAGVLSEASVLDIRDGDGIRFSDALGQMQLDCTAPLGGCLPAAYLELHIEQGPLLEAGGHDVGFVTVGQGHRWYDVTLHGFESHTGSTPMVHRRDALLGAAKLIEAVHMLGMRYAPDGVATVGALHVKPNSRNVIAGEAKLAIDVRHPDPAMLQEMHDAVQLAFQSCLVETRISGDIVDISNCPPVPFDPSILAVVRQQAATLGLRGRDIVSGAGHDAFHLAKVTPSAMIFTPCRDGISHNEAEDITQDWATNGANLLMRTALVLANQR